MTTIKPARSYSPNWVPTTEDIEEAELGVNGATGKIWMRDDNFQIREVGGLYSGIDLPRSDPGISGAFWNDDGILKVSAG